MNTDNTLLNAVIGAVATIGLSFTGISPVLGGALALTSTAATPKTGFGSARSRAESPPSRLPRS